MKKKSFILLFVLLSNCIYSLDVVEMDPLYIKLQKRNLNFNSFWGEILLRELYVEHRINYSISGTLPISKNLLRFLLKNPKEAVFLINAYQNTDYKLQYLDSDKSSFEASTKGLVGRMRLLTSGNNFDELVYYGEGSNKFLWWKMYGTVLILFSYEQIQKDMVSYQFNCYVFNESSFINNILSLGIVQSVIKKRIQGIVDNIVNSTLCYKKGDMVF